MQHQAAEVTEGELNLSLIAVKGLVHYDVDRVYDDLRLVALLPHPSNIAGVKGFNGDITKVVQAVYVSVSATRLRDIGRGLKNILRRRRSRLLQTWDRKGNQPFDGGRADYKQPGNLQKLSKAIVILVIIPS